jgi:uncharacterized membrane protein
VAWIDLFRGAAVLVMIETHVVNTFLAASLREESWFTVLNYLNGLVAPSFLFIAGFVQGMAWSAAPTKPVKFGLRARTLLGIGFIAYALHFPWTELGQHRLHDAIRVGSQIDVLQCITASLGALLLVTWITQKLGPRRGEFAWWLGVSTLLLLTVLPAPAAAHWNPAFVPLRAWLNFSTGSWFPLFPWAAFIFAGALIGAALPCAASEDVSRPAVSWPLRFRGTSSSPSVLVLAPVPLALSAWAFVGVGHSPVSLSSFLERIAWVLVLAALSEWLAARRVLPKVVLFAGKHSLTLYVTHLVLISTIEQVGVPFQSFSAGTVIAIIPGVLLISLFATFLIVQIGDFFRRPERPSALESSVPSAP